MKGFKEILLSLVIGLLTLTILGGIRHHLKDQPRAQVQDEPVVSSGEDAEDSGQVLNWGLQEIKAPAAWTLHRGSRNVVVAVIDTGCDVHHTDLASNIWINPGESGLDASGSSKATNGIDDDDNGFVDDVHGWNFSENSSDLEDRHGHGTHIAGIIGGANHPGGFSIGVAPQVSLMILKYYDTAGDGKSNLDHTIEAIRYAVKNGANIINYSGGGVMKSAEEEQALAWASAQGVLVVAAAGNEGSNSDFYHFYPADYELPNILSVAAIDRQEHLLSMSNFGLHSVDLAAPGKNIFSTLPNNQYGYMSGTSQATAFVTGVAALLMANDPRFQDPQELIAHLLAHSSPRGNLRGKVRTASILDASLALTTSDLLSAQAVRRQPSKAF